MKKIKLVVSDIDCTLIGRDEIVPAVAASFKERLEKKGVLFTVATGRVESNALQFVKALGITIPFVATNGATIASPDGKCIMHKTFPARLGRQIMEEADREGLSVIYTIDGIEYVFDENAEYIRQYPHRFKREGIQHRLTDEDYSSLMIDKISIMSSRDENNVISRLEKMCAGHESEFIYTRYQDKSIELVNPEATKASGVRNLASMLGITMDEVLAVGDHQNDIEMLSECALGCVVANATDEARAAADYISPFAVADGVNDIISRFILET